MKGYDARAFPREGDPALVCLEASEEDAARTAWTSDVPAFPRVPPRRSSARRSHACSRSPARRAPSTRRWASSSHSERQAADRMVGEPTTFTLDWFTGLRAGRRGRDARARRGARRRDRAGDRSRMRLANEIAAARDEDTCRLVIEPGMTEARDRGRVGGLRRTARARGWQGQVDLALGFSLVWSGPGIKTFTATTSRPVVEGEPTLFEIWVCVDGYWARPHEEPRRRRADPASTGQLEERLLAVYGRAVQHSRPGASLAELGPPRPRGHRRDRLPRASRRTRSATASARGRTSRRTRTRREAARSPPGMVLAIEPGCYMAGGGGLRVEDNFLVTENGRRRSFRRSRTGSWPPQR